MAPACAAGYTRRVNRFVDFASRHVVKGWIAREERRPIPWSPLRVPLSKATVALVSSAAVARRDDTPFDQEGERANPWWGDPTHRVIPRGARSDDVRVYHLHIDPAFGDRDVNCVLPIDRLDELAASGLVGEPPASHYSYMGYILEPRELLAHTVPAMLQQMHAEEVDAVVLVPA
jgi:D-proline reductase (dithiol) PrdB